MAVCQRCSKEISSKLSFCKYCGWPASERSPLPAWMALEEYKACATNFGLLEGEQIALMYGCKRLDADTYPAQRRKGLLVFTNDNMIFMQEEGWFSKTYSQALRVLLEKIIGISSGGTFDRYTKIRTEHGEYDFRGLPEARERIERHLESVREEKKRLAQQALRGERRLEVVFCRYCGSRNRADQSNCGNCGASLE